MEREVYYQLGEWKKSDFRKPIVLRGARQVGKTYSLLSFGKREYSDTIYVNFDENPRFAEFFTENLEPDRILNDLSIYFKKPIHPGSSLIIFDEVQECPNALNSLKYFCEKRNDYHIVTAGSLLGVKLSKGFPVGKVNFIDMLPLTFFEFLNAMGESSLVTLLSNISTLKPILNLFHEKLIKFLRYYFIIGGMPEAVAMYLKTGSFSDARNIQKAILDAYTLDFAKHSPKNELMKIMAIWELLPGQLSKENKKFIFSAIKKSARGREYQDAIQWLVDSGLLIKSYNIETPRLPLKAYANHNAFKIYSLDVGLLGAMSKLDPLLVLEESRLFTEFKRALTENFVAQELRRNYFDNIFYWTSAGQAEIDFIISETQKIYPLEVNAGENKQKKSLIVYGNKYSTDKEQSPVLSRATLRNFAHDGNIVNYPLYAVALFPQLLKLQGL